MTAIKFPDCNACFNLPGCTDLPAQTKEGIIRTQWELTEQERAIVAAGGQLVLEFRAATVPPMRLNMHYACQHCKATLRDGEEVLFLEDGRAVHAFCADIAAAGA